MFTRKVILVFTALSVLVTSCTTKYWVPSEQIKQEPIHKITSVITVEGEYIDFPDGVTIQDNKIVGRMKDGTLKVIPLPEIKTMSYERWDTVKNTIIGCGILGCIFVWWGFYTMLVAFGN